MPTSSGQYAPPAGSGSGPWSFLWNAEQSTSLPTLAAEGQLPSITTDLNPVNQVQAAVGVTEQVATGALSSAVQFVFQTVGSFLVNFVTGAISAVKGSTATHLLGLVVGLVVVVVLFH